MKKMKGKDFCIGAVVLMVLLAIAPSINAHGISNKLPDGGNGPFTKYTQPQPQADDDDNSVYEVVWEDTYYGAGMVLDVASDFDNNYIVVGVTHSFEGAVVKYNGVTGEVIWDNIISDSVMLPFYEGETYQPTSDISRFYCIRNLMLDVHQQRYDFSLDPTGAYFILITGVDIFSNGDVVIVATAIDNTNDNDPSDVYIAKYSGLTGEVIWERLLDLYVWDFGYSVAVTSNDNVIVVGVSGGYETHNGQLLPIMDGWVYKLDGDNEGCTLDQSHIFGITQPLPYYFDVALDSNNNVFATGACLIIDWSNFPEITDVQTVVVNRYSGTTLNLQKSYYGNPAIFTWLCTITIDTENKIYVGGHINNPTTNRYIMKFTNNLNTSLWTLQNVPGEVVCLAASKNPNVDEIAAQIGGNGFITDRFTFAGAFIAPEIIEHLNEGCGMAIVYDGNNDMVVTGSIEGGWDVYMHTMKYHIFR
ncbi:MAG: hypothetical protein QXL17_01265 [Candidatus Thermoplasmatota archaeon]